MLDLVGTGSVVGRYVIIIYVCVSNHTIYYAFVYVSKFDIVDYIYGASADTAFYSHIWIWSQFYISKDDYNQKASGFLFRWDQKDILMGQFGTTHWMVVLRRPGGAAGVYLSYRFQNRDDFFRGPEMLRKWLEMVISIIFIVTGQLPHANGMSWSAVTKPSRNDCWLMKSKPSRT
jgi:hypothetical protein